MQALLAKLNEADRQLSRLTQAIPNLSDSLNHHLFIVFPDLTPGSSVDTLYINHEEPPLPGQQPRLISRSLNSLICQSYASQQIPNGAPQTAKLYRAAYSLDEQDIVPGIGLIEVELFTKYITHNLERRVRSAHEHFWKTAHLRFNNSTPKDWLCTFIRDLLQTENDVRHADGTLSTLSQAAVNQMLTYATYRQRLNSNVTKPIAVYGVALKGEHATQDVHLQGLLVLADNTASGLGDAMHSFNRSHDQGTRQETTEPTHSNVVFYSPVSGLEEFDSLHALSLELEARLADVNQREALLDFALLSERDRAKGLNQVGYREITHNTLTTYVDELIDKCAKNLQYAWATARSQGQERDLQALAAHIDQAKNASLSLNPAGILLTRYARLLEAQLPDWLKQASDEHKQQWRRAVQQLDHEQQSAQVLDVDDSLSEYSTGSLLSFAKARLKRQIKADHDLDVDPDALFIVTTQALQTGPAIYPLNPTTYPAGASIGRTGPTISLNSTRVSLSVLALTNVRALDITYTLTAQVEDSQGQHHPVLTPAYIKTLVRQQNIGERYVEGMRSLLIYDPALNTRHAQAQWRMERHVAVAQAQLRLDILEARLIDTPSHALNDEDVSRVGTLLNYPKDNERPRVEGKRVDTHLLELNGYVLPGLWVISTEPPTQLLCYTPYAPDKIWFRRVETLEVLAQTLGAEGLNNYVLQRVSFAQQPYVRHLLNKGLNASALKLVPAQKQIFEACYDEESQFILRNADEQSTSTWETTLETIKDVVLISLDVVSFVLPLKVRLLYLLGRFVHTVTQGIDALARGEQQESTFLYFLAITHLTGAASEFAGSRVFARAIRQRLPAPVATLNPKAASSARTQSMRLRLEGHYTGGIYETTDATNGQRLNYLKGPKSEVYRCQYNYLRETWYIIDERQPLALYRTAMVHDISTGHWNPLNLTSHTPPASLPELIQRASVAVDLTGIAPDAQGLYTLNNLIYIKQNTLVFEVHKGWLARQLFLQVPGTSRWGRTRYKVRRQSSTSAWEVKNRLVDKTRQWQPLTLEQPQRRQLSSTTSLSQYDTAEQHAAALRTIMTSGKTNLHDYGYPLNNELDTARTHAYGIQVRMHEDAQKFFKAYSYNARPQLPEIPQNASAQDMFKLLYSKTSGIIVGEAHHYAGSKKLIIDNMQFLAEQNVKVLYLEHLQTDFHQRDLNAFFDTGHMPIQLEHFLRSQDLGHRVNSSTYTFSNLVREAQRHGIRIQALDCFVSYHCSGLERRSALNPRIEMMSYGASQIIRNDQTFTPRRWLALTGNTHTNTYQGIPGLAELEGGIGLRIMDVAPGSQVSLRRDPGLITSRLGAFYDHQLIKSDFVLDVEIPGTPSINPRLPATYLQRVLKQPGAFTFGVSLEQRPELIHRSRSGLIVYTPLQIDTRGNIFISRPAWLDIHEKRYALLSDLVADLQNRGMSGQLSG